MTTEMNVRKVRLSQRSHKWETVQGVVSEYMEEPGEVMKPFSMKRTSILIIFIILLFICIFLLVGEPDTG